MEKKHHFRLLPLVIFASVFMFTIKVGEVWRSFAYPELTKSSLVKIGPLAAEEEKAKATASSSSASTSPSASAKPTAPTTASTAPASEEASAPVAEGGKVVSSAAVSSLSADTGFSQSEIDVLQNLAERRESLDSREKEINQQLAIIQAAEQQIDYKLLKLKELQASIQELIKTYDTKEKEKMDSLVRIYSNMKPKDAARIFNDLEMNVLVQIVEQMKEAKSSAIISLMDSKKAHALTLELAKRKEITNPIDKKKL